MTNYTDSSLISNYLGRDLISNEKATLSVLLPAIKKWIDLNLGSTFDSVAASTRKFDGGSCSIDIDPCTAITAIDLVDNDGNVESSYATGDYVAEPVNETVKRELRVRYGKFPKGYSNVRVSAKFSEYNDGIPEDIQIAATRIAAAFLNSAMNVGSVQSETIEGHSITYSNESFDKTAMEDPIVQSILAMRRELVIG